VDADKRAAAEATETALREREEADEAPRHSIN